MTDPHRLHRLEKALADDERTNELGVRVTLWDDHVVVEGEVASDDRRRAVHQVLQEIEPGLVVTDRLVLSADQIVEPPESESISGPTEKH